MRRAILRFLEWPKSRTSSAPAPEAWETEARFGATGGFTLLELLVVMVIIGLLASYVAPRYFEQVGKSEVKTARAQLDAFEKALGAYRLEVGRYPSTEQGLEALTAKPADEARWAGPYLSRSVPTDPWGRAYEYRRPGSAGHDFDLLSLGKDGRRGGEGLDADISLWDNSRK